MSALSFTMPSKTCIKKIQPMNQTVSMDVTMYPLLRCQSSSGSVAKRVILLYHIIVGMKRVGVYNSLSYLIGASLSEPHTSSTTLWTCVCIFSCWLSCLLGYLRPYKFEMSAFRYFTKTQWTSSDSLMSSPLSMKGYFQSSASAWKRHGAKTM